MLKFLNGWGASLKRDAIHLWKQRCFEAVVKRHQEVQETHFHSQNNSDINRQKEIDDQAPKYLLKSQQSLMKKIFEILFDYRTKRKLKTIAHDEVDDKFGFLRKRYQFQKWRLRADQTIIYRQKQKILMRTWHLSRKRNLFNAFRAHHQKHNNLQRLLSHMNHNVTQENLRYAWRHIESKAHMNRQTTDRKFKDNQILIHNLSMKLWHRSLKRRFDQLLANSRASHGKNANLNSIMHKAINRFNRDFFNKWKKNADMLEVIRFNNEEGPVRIEVHHKKAEILALKEMIKDRQILDDQGINEILDENEEKYKTAINQSLARLNLHGQGKNKENDDWIKPYCLDKWKLWLQERKSYKHALNMCDMHIKGGDLLDISQAFRKWKRIAMNLHDHLHAQTQENLMDRDHKNNLELVDVKNQLEDAHHEIGDMKNQREYLIEKVVIGQRLALARCRDSFRHVLHKAFARWHHFKHDHAKAQFHGHLTGNKDTLEAHKQRLEDVHEENVNIADQNHELHQGAKEGVAHLDKVDGLHADVTHLNEQIVAQAAQLQKLLAQNKQLKKQVAEHEGKH